MKQTLCAMMLLLGSMSALLISCEKNQQESSNEMFNVYFELCGDISVSNEALTKSTPTNDLYGINVYYDVNKDGNIDTKYAYGLFDNTLDMTIPLLANHKYKFECTVVINGKTKLQSSNVGKYEAPFGQILENKFVLGTNVSMDGIKKGTSLMKGESTAVNIPKLERYYGEITNYEPTLGGTIRIDLARCSFGAQFVINGLVNDGTLTASCENVWSITTQSDVSENANIYTFPDVYSCWANKSDYVYNTTAQITYDSNRGPEWDITKSQTISFKRNILTVVKINISPDLSGGSVPIVVEEMEDDNLINLTINGDGILDNTIDPVKE